MLTPDQIASLRERASKITDPITEYLLRDIVRRIAQVGELTSTAAYQIWRAQQLGVSQREIKKELRRLLGLSNEEIQRIMYESAQAGYSLDVSRFPTVDAVPFEQNLSLQQIVSAAVKLAQEDFTNTTQTIGMVDQFGNALPLQDAYRSCTDFAFKQVITGAASYTEAIRQATRNLADKRLRVIDYKSGVHTSLEASVRRNIMGGLGLMQEQISQTVHDQLGCDGWEITAHANSAPDHEPIQGKQYPDEEYQKLNNALQRRIGTLNCGHAAFPIILGVNSPQYTPEELEKFREDNEKGVTVDGVHYTGYQATQMQRKLERAIRRQKYRIMVDEAAGDQKKLAQDKTKLTILHQRYREFSKAAGLRTQYERTEVAGFGEKRGSSSRRAKPVEISSQSGTIVSSEQNGAAAVREVCRLDIKKYRCVSQNIATDEVIITGERIAHIQARHPEDYERFSTYIPKIIRDPDYIIEDTRPNTAMVLKEIVENGERFRLTLRIVTPEDHPGYKNSVITFMKIRESEWRRLIRNKKILYKSE